RPSQIHGTGCLRVCSQALPWLTAALPWTGIGCSPVTGKDAIRDVIQGPSSWTGPTPAPRRVCARGAMQSISPSCYRGGTHDPKVGGLSVGFAPHPPRATQSGEAQRRRAVVGAFLAKPHTAGARRKGLSHDRAWTPTAGWAGPALPLNDRVWGGFRF